MININDHVVEIEGKQYVPFDIAVKAINNVLESTKTIDDLHVKLAESLKNLSDLKLDD